MSVQSAGSFLSRVPTLPELYKHVIKKVAHDWEPLCISLELDEDGAKLEAIRRDHIQHGVEKCCLHSLLPWLKGGGKKPVTWNTLLACLQDNEFNKVAKNIKEALKEDENHEIAESETDSFPLPAVLESTLAMAAPPVRLYHLKPEIEKELRDYQLELALPGLSGQNYIVCAPTGSGKTRVAGLVISEHLKSMGGHGRVLFVVNKVPLVQQQREALQGMIQGAKFEEVSGDAALHKKAAFSVSLQNTDSVATSSEEDDSEQPRFQHDRDVIVCTGGCLLNALTQEQVSLSSISLLVIDECHNTRKKSDYARIMEIYLRAKMSNGKVPQVMGLTATPGAGEASRPTIASVLDHLVTFCAFMDATGGIQTVSKEIQNLKLYQKSAKRSTILQEGRSEEEPFISLIVKIITILEGLIKLKPPPHNKWSQKYTEWINNRHAQSQEKGNCREKVSILRTLKGFAATLKVYNNLTHDDAMDELRKITFSSNPKGIENDLSRVTDLLRNRLSSLERVENPLLLQLEAALEKKFKSAPDSKAIVFVETKTEATSITRWIKSQAKLSNIRPDSVMGQTRDTGTKMTKAEQSASLSGFRGEEFNLIVSTSVLEEGVDVPACNLVLSYQKVSNEIAQVQSRGRARASNSHCLTIVNSNSGKQFQEMLNEEKIALVEQALVMLPHGENLQQQMKPKQQNLVQQLGIRKEMETNHRRHQYNSLEVDVHCRSCDNFLCNASHLYTIPNTTHHIIREEDFFNNVLIRTHPNPTYDTTGLSRIAKIFCKECEVQKLGVIGRWWRHPVNYPVLKCPCIKFKVAGRFVPCKQWKDVPFRVPTLEL